jgi:serine O-acetyltransferase
MKPMEHDTYKIEKCREEKLRFSGSPEEVPSIVDRLVESCGGLKSFEDMNPVPIPSLEDVIEILHQARRVLFPKYFSKERLDPVNLGFFLGKETTDLFERLSQQVLLAIQHECLAGDSPCVECVHQSRDRALHFIRVLPETRRTLDLDIEAALSGDPAAKSTDEIIFCYPGIFAVTVYRLAHILYELQVPLLPRMMTEYAHGQTGIDIHPGAEIGKSFFIDHGTGVVIGETTRIGDRVRLYQGVTLGALSLPADAGARFRNTKRHPTVEDDVIIYANATLLGAEAVVGARSVIGGNVWITDRVPPDTKILLKRPELIYRVNDKETAETR